MAMVSLLVVEGDVVVAHEITKELVNIGYSVCAVVHDGRTAIARTAEMKPDLVLVDIGLRGEINGIETATRIQDRYNLPVVYLADGADSKTNEEQNEDDTLGYVVNLQKPRSLERSIEMALFRAQGKPKEDYREKLRSFLENTGEICHELNQPMMAISGLSELLLITMDQGDPAYEKIAKIQSQVQRLNAITQKLRGIAHEERTAFC